MVGSLYQAPGGWRLVEDKPKIIGEQEHMLLWYMFKQKPYCLTKNEELEL